MERKNLIKITFQATYNHMCSTQIGSFQTAVRQIGVIEICFSKIRHFEINEPEIYIDSL